MHNVEEFFNPVVFFVGILAIFFVNSPSLLFRDKGAWREFIECSVGGTLVFSAVFFIAKLFVHYW